MKAIVYEKYGPADVLRLAEIEKPSPNDNEVLIQVHAASANPLDWHNMRGVPVIVRTETGLRKPKTTRLGIDLAGKVEAVGRDVTVFRPGDEVFGMRGGAFAEYVCTQGKVLAVKPANLSFEQAAAVPVAGVTALQALRDKGRLHPGQKVLINGAAGGVGTFAVQIANALGAEVTGVCSTRNLEMVRSIGANHVIDYTQVDFTRNGQAYDLIIDNVGNRSVSDTRRALCPEGICVIVGFSSLVRLLQAMLLAPLMSKTGGKKIGFLGMANGNSADLDFLKQLLEAGTVVPVIDRRYPLRETAEAIRYLEEGHARGKVVITVEHSNQV